MDKFQSAVLPMHACQSSRGPAYNATLIIKKLKFRTDNRYVKNCKTPKKKCSSGHTGEAYFGKYHSFCLSTML